MARRIIAMAVTSRTPKTIPAIAADRRVRQKLAVRTLWVDICRSSAPDVMAHPGAPGAVRASSRGGEARRRSPSSGPVPSASCRTFRAAMVRVRWMGR